MSMQPISVFIVDDSPQLTEILRELVSEAGRIEVTGCADSAANAIEGILTGNPDFAIIDLQLKAGSGLDVVKAIRGRTGDIKTTIILFTNHTSSELRRRAMDMGVDFFMDKSRDHTLVLELIRERARTRFAQAVSAP